PDVIFIDGHGISHPRGIGLASYVGLVLDKPTIGIAKSILTGVIKDDKLLNGKQVGWVIRKGKRKVFISPGQKISLKTSRELVLHTIIHMVPEPIRLADRYAAKVKNEKLQSE
ncbi:MAG: endonuclease V, partial [Candidatus Aenigmatarchaeota archaeon]